MITVVFCADLLACGLLEPASASVLRLWGGRAIRPALNRPLFVRYLRVLRAMGLNQEQLRWWGWWLTASETAQFIQEEVDQSTDHSEECVHLAALAKAEVIISGTTLFGAESRRGSGQTGVPWESAGDFVKRFEQRRNRG